MAHIEKFTKGAMGHMLEHYDRSKKKLGDNVDIEKSYLNYNLAEHQQLSQLDFIHQRLSEVKLQNRKDVNVLCDWAVTIPKDFLEKYPGKEKEFFKATYNFLENKYGKDNVVSAYVHRDETTPHLHFAFIPVVEDKKKGGYKVSAKEAITRNDLRNFHQNLSNYLEQVLGVQVNVLNGATKDGNKSIEELKRNTATKEIEKLNSEIKGLEQQIKNNKGYMSMYDNTKTDYIQFEELPAIVSKFVGNNKVLADKKQITNLNKKLKGLLTRDMTYKDVLHKAYSEADKIIVEAREKGKIEANKIIIQSKKEIDSYTESKIQDIAKQEQSLADKIKGLKSENTALKNRLNKLEPVADRLNDLEKRWSRLVEVSKAKEFPKQVKDYINNGTIPRVKSKGIER